MSVQLGRKLNLIVPIELDEGKVAYVHSMPLSRAAFEAHFMILSRTFNEIYNQGLNVLTGPGVASILLRQQARIVSATRDHEGDETEANTLLAEIRRLSNVVLPTETGWETIPYQEARDKKIWDDDVFYETENEVVFFICNSALHRRAVLRAFLAGMCDLWGTQTTPSSVTEFAASLPTLTLEDVSTETALAKGVRSEPF